MSNSIFTDRAAQALSMALDGLSLRQQAIAHNVANADTPGYKAVDVSFEAQLQRVLDGQNEDRPRVTRTNVHHLAAPQNVSSPEAQTVRRFDTSLRNDGNNVDIDLEMVQLAETTLRYNALTLLASKKLGLIKNVISGSR